MKTVGYLQFEPVLRNIVENRRRIADALREADGDLIVLPELAFTGYSLEDRFEAESLAEDPYESESITMLTDICRKRNLHLVCGFAEKAPDGVYNSAVLVGPAGTLGVYRKIHLFGFEKELFDPGPEPPKIFDIDGMKVGMMICFDWFFPETARMLALAGADIIAHPANLVLDWCQRSMLTRCLENNVFAVTANRYGSEERKGQSLSFTGASQITAPRGLILGSANTSGDALQLVEIDLATARDKNVTSANHLLNDRRTALYESLLG